MILLPGRNYKIFILLIILILQMGILRDLMKHWVAQSKAKVLRLYEVVLQRVVTYYLIVFNLLFHGALLEEGKAMAFSHVCICV